MSEPILATLNVAFAEDETEVSSSRIILRQASKRFNALGSLTVHCFPSRGVTFVASVGRVETAEVRSWSAWEGVKFSNSATATLKYPGATNVVLNTDTMVLMQKTQDIYGRTVIRRATGITLRWIPDEEVVAAETSLGVRVPVYGGCFVQYQALYQVLYYYPNTQATPVGGGNYSFVWTTGTIFAYNEMTVETLDLELDIKNSPEMAEFARVTSKIVLDELGVWEYPENWESTYASNRDKLPDRKADFTEPGRFSYYTNTYEVDAQASFTDIRVHCIVRVNTTGNLFYEDFNNGGDGYTFWNMPYRGLTGYHPRYELQWIDPPGGKKASSAEDFKHDVNNTTWRDVFLSVDKTAITNKFKDEYPGIRNDQGVEL